MARADKTGPGAAQADQAAAAQGDEAVASAALDAALEAEDIPAAHVLIEAFAADATLPPAALQAMRDRVWRAKSALTKRYTKEISAAIEASDLDAMRRYSALLLELSRREERAGPAVGAQPAEAPATEPEAELDLAAIRRALDQGRLLPPAEDNAFTLTMTALEQAPTDPEVLALLDAVIERQEALVVAGLEAGEPAAALELAEQLRGALERLEPMAALSFDRRSSAFHWFARLRPRLVEGLTAAARRAIGQRRLTVAPDGAIPAIGYLERLAAIPGTDEQATASLAAEVVAAYQALIDEQVDQGEFAGALMYVPRLEAVAERLELAPGVPEARRREIETLQATRLECERLLEMAADMQDAGQVIAPAERNALTYAARARSLEPTPRAAERLLETLIADQQSRIARMIDSGRLDSAEAELAQFAAAIDRNNLAGLASAPALQAQADRLRREIAAREREEIAQRQAALAAAEVVESRSAEPRERRPAADDGTGAFTFISPF